MNRVHGQIYVAYTLVLVTLEYMTTKTTKISYIGLITINSVFIFY